MKIKKFLFLIIFSLLILVSGIVLANDASLPTINADSIFVSNKNATIGDTIKISIKVTNPDKIKYIGVRYIKPQTGYYTDIIYLSYNSETDSFEKTLNIDNNWQSGTYKIYYTFISDDTNSKIYYNDKNKINNTNYFDLSSGDFNVYGTNADIIFPTIDASTLTVSNQKVITGDTVDFSIKIMDNVGISKAYIYLKQENSYKTKIIELNYDENKKTFTGKLIIDEDMAEGEWYIYEAYAEDTNDNYIYIYAKKFYNYDGYDWIDKTIYNHKYYTKPEFTKNSLLINKSSFTNGDTLNISLEAMDKFGIEKVKIYYNNDNLKNKQCFEANFNKINSIKSTNCYDFYYNNYVVTFNFKEYGCNGNWKIDKIEILSIKDVLTTVYNSEFYSQEDAIDLSAGNFLTYGLVDDIISPTINSYRISKNIANYQEKLTLSIDVKDNQSGIKNVIVNYNLPDSTNKDYYLKLDNNEYVYDFEYDSYDKVGKYTINYILVEDYAGNIEKLERINISNIDFTFKTYIDIITPAQYLKTYTSYNLKVIQNNKYKNDGIVWTSSDTSIASINSQTGTLSTKGKYGKVTITASLNDGSNIYTKIDLIVAGISLKIGETSTVGFPNYISYSSVVWKIEDETIAMLTGHNMYISIGSSYKHSTEIKGLKEGKTKINMLTESGDLLSSSEIIVYKSATFLISNKDRISMQKGDKETINVSTNYIDLSKDLEKIFYLSENENVATVDDNGNITATGNGNTNIIAITKYNDIKLKIPVDVTVNATELNLNTKEINFSGDNKSFQLEYEIEPKDVSNNLVTYMSSNENVVVVDSNGLVRAIDNGTAIITVKTNDGMIIREIPVKITNLKKEIESISLNKSSLILTRFDKYEFEVIINPSDTTEDKTIIWTSNFPDIVSVDQNGNIEAKKTADYVLITAKTLNGKIATCSVKVEEIKNLTVEYRTHVQDYGWQGYVKDGEMAGTSGKAKRLEAININIENTNYEGNIEYRTHVQNYGWQDYVKNGEMAGTSGESKRLEAIQIRLTGELSKYYDVYYRVHCQNLGWMNWAKNGEKAGSAGYSLRLEAIEIIVVQKGYSPPNKYNNINYMYPYVSKLIEYRTHVQNYGWQNYVQNGDTSGTSGQSKRLEAINIRLINDEYNGNIEYRTHVQDYGWQDYVRDGEIAGTTGESKRLEAIQIRLTGEITNYYDIYYRVHCQNIGWMNWAKNGEMSGTSGFSYRLEAIEIVLVKKGENPKNVYIDTIDTFRQNH